MPKRCLRSVYWFDDRENGGKCRAPASWKLTAFQNGKWQEVSGVKDYGVSSNELNEITFDPVKTYALRLEIQLQEGFSAGLLQLRKE